MYTDNCSLPKRDRNGHIQTCVRREIASRRVQLQTDVHYCHQCFNWVVGSKEWTEHCGLHVKGLDSKKCGTITYCHTLVRPGYCPFCLGEAPTPAQRLQSWCRDAALWGHVDKHLKNTKWPLKCPHPRCDTLVVDGQDLRFHLIDDHGFSRQVPKKVKHLRAASSDTGQAAVSSTKRKHTQDTVELSWLPAEQPAVTSSKRARREISTVALPQLSLGDESKDPLELIDLTTPESPTNLPEEALLSGGRWGSGLIAMHESRTDSLTRFASCDSTLVDHRPGESEEEDQDLIFSQFIRSPSPDSVATTDGTDVDESPVATTNLGSSPLCRPMFDQISPRLDLTQRSKNLQSNPDKTNKGLRIRLRVEAPKPKITLRLPALNLKRQKSTKGELGKSAKHVKQARTAQATRTQEKSKQTSRIKLSPPQKTKHSSRK